MRTSLVHCDIGRRAWPPLGVTIGLLVGLLVGLGMLAARLGGGPLLRGALRVTFWGAMAMAATALVGRVLGTVA